MFECIEFNGCKSLYVCMYVWYGTCKLVGYRVGVNSHSPQSDVCGGFECLLVHRYLLQVVQRLPAIYHPVGGVGGGGGQRNMEH